MNQPARRTTPVPQKPQQKASDPQTSVWVNASAGSGKTTILTQRVTRLLLQGVAPQRILCLTFTRAAAAEMAIRVMETLGAWATGSDDMLGKSLGELQGHAPSPKQMQAARRLFARALSCPGGLRIRTIHAFAQEVLRRFPIEAGLPPHFTVIEETDARALQEDVLMELLRDTPDVPSSPLKLLVCDLGEKGFREAMGNILHERARLEDAETKAGGLDKLIARMRSTLALAPDETEDRIIRAAIDDGVLCRPELMQAAEALMQGLATCREFGTEILQWLALPPQGRQIAFASYSDCFFTSTGALHKNYADKKTLGAWPDAEKVLAREATRLQSVRERLETARIAAITAAVLSVGSELIRRYEIRKAQQALLDYDDLIIRTDALLRRPGIAPWVLYKLDGGLDHLLVDEAQDTSPMQWDIIKALAEEFFSGKGAKDDVNRTLFAVGDEKQSIFSFQHADPAAFATTRAFFARRIDEAKKTYAEMPLQVSYRSAPAILQAVDAVFAGERARAGVSDVPVLHKAFYPGKIGRVEVWPLIKMPEKDKTGDGVWALPLDYEDERDPQAELAHNIADKIAHWLATGEKLPGADAAIAPGDIMILLRRRGRFADLMVHALKEHKVPVTGVDRMHLIRQLPVMDLLALMQFALLPEDDLNLAAVLRGPLLSLSEEQLMTLAIGRKGTLWHSLTDKAKNDRPFAAAHDYLARWLGAADFMTPFAMLAQILNKPCPGNAVSGRRAIWARLGPDALDPIEELLNAAQDFSRRHAPSLQSFLHWLTAGDSEIKRELDRGGSQVRIMTVHAAKGLEAPIVFLPDTANMPRAQDVPEFLWHTDGAPLYLPRKPGSGAARALWDDARARQLEEYRRLLYVALTRAANGLYIGGWEVKKEPDSEGCWYNLIAEALKPLHQPAAVGDEQPQPDIVLADPELRAEQKSKSENPPAGKMKLPDWVFKSAPAEPVAPRPVAPSQILQPPATATPDGAFARGRIVHRLLQSLPDMIETRRDAAAARFLANPQHRLTTAQQAELKAEVLNLMRDPAYAPLFGADSRAEVPLAGIIGGEKISGQLDRLCVQGDAVWIVDYKTNRPPPERVEDVSEAYRVQLAKYRAVLRAIYPHKMIRCFLLWTYGPRLMELPPEMLAS